MSGARSYASLLLLAIGFFVIFMTLWNHFSSQRSDSPVTEEPLFESNYALSTLPTMNDIRRSQQRFDEWMENHPCGVLRVTSRIRLFNVTGHVTSQTRPGSRVRLFITPNTSFNHSMYVIENCGPLWKAEVGSTMRNFSVNGIPAGKYILYLPIESFPEGRQGFPVPDEFEIDGYELKVVFHGGNPKHSLSAFEIGQVPSSKSS